MKFTATCILISAGSFISGADARPMHTNINYARYLQQKDSVAEALQNWMDFYGPFAREKGLIPASETRSSDDTQEDHLQRFFMAQELVDKLNAESNGAVFSTHSPFTLLTEQEFSEYVSNAYITAHSNKRRLREAVEDDEGVIGVSQNVIKSEEPQNVIPSWMDFQEMLKQWFNSMMDMATHKPKPINRAKTSFNFDDVPEQPDPVSPVKPYVPFWPDDTPVNPFQPTSEPNPTPVEPYQPTTQPDPRPLPVNPGYQPYSPQSDPGSGHGVAPMTVDWATHNCMAPIQDQGSCGSCWAFATISAVETSQCLYQKSPTVIKYSENTLASCDQRDQGCNGGVPAYALDYIQRNGVCIESDDPYTGKRGFLGQCSSCTRRQTGMKGYSNVRGDAELVAALNQGPVVMALSGSNAAFKHYQSGPLTIGECSEYANIDHAVVAVGYNDHVIKIRNSWGPRWGVDGYVYIDRAPSSNRGTCGIYSSMKQVVF